MDGRTADVVLGVYPWGIKDHRGWDLPGDGYGDFLGGLIDGGGEPLEDFPKF